MVYSDEKIEQVINFLVEKLIESDSTSLSNAKDRIACRELVRGRYGDTGLVDTAIKSAPCRSEIVRVVDSNRKFLYYVRCSFLNREKSSYVLSDNLARFIFKKLYKDITHEIMLHDQKWKYISDKSLVQYQKSVVLYEHLRSTAADLECTFGFVAHAKTMGLDRRVSMFYIPDVFLCTDSFGIDNNILLLRVSQSHSSGDEFFIFIDTSSINPSYVLKSHGNKRSVLLII